MARKPEFRTAATPPPVGGWDTRNALADMPITNAAVLDNWFPRTDDVQVRKGYAEHASGVGAAVETLLHYEALDGSDEMFACGNTAIYDVTSSGAVGAAAVSGLTNDRWQSTGIGTAGGQFLFCCNGADTPQTYDGSAWANTTLTGPTVTDVIWCNLHQRRLWLGEVAQLSAWYLAVNSITGAATEFSFAGVAGLGGFVMNMGTWTRDAGDGADDVAVFLTSEGEAILYQGTDPGDAAAWSLVGVFRIGKPIGRRCMIKAGADLIMVTQDGFVAASSILSADRSQADRVAISAQINSAVNTAVKSHGARFGWQPFIYPKGTQLLFNVPQSATTAHQYVFNTITNAPCRFTAIPALCWSLMDDDPYFGASDGKVYKYDSGFTDDGSDIAVDAIQAFSAFKSPQTNKQFTRIKPIFKGLVEPSVAVDVNTDFQVVNTSPAYYTPGSTQTGRWGIGLWGIALWGGENEVFGNWRGVRGYGRTGGLRIRATINASQPSWLATYWMFVPGGPY